MRTHIESGAPDAWKASIRVLEMAFAGHDIAEPLLPTNAADIANMGWRDLTLLAARLSIGASPDAQMIENQAIANVLPSSENGA